jgi:replicative superfamily II helicase
VNLPAASVIIDGLHRGDSALSVVEYKNMVGRAGRTGSAGGRSFIVLDDEGREQAVWRTYVTGRPEELRSRVLDQPTDLRPTVLAALSDAVRSYDRTRRDGIDEFLATSFAAHQARHDFPFGGRLPSADTTTTVTELREAELVRREGSRLTLAPLGQIASRSGLGIEVVIATARALRAIDPGSLNAATLICLLHLAVAADRIFIPSSREGRRAQDIVATWMHEEQHVPLPVLAELRRDREAHVPRLLAAQVCLRWMDGLPAMKIGNMVPGFRGSRPMVPVSQIAKQAADRVETVLDIAREIRPVTELGSLARTLPIQLEFGVRDAQVDLVRQVGPAIGRFGYRSLALKGILTPNDVVNASDERLLDCLNHYGHYGHYGLVRTVQEGAARALAEARDEDEGPALA